ncbi:hypothetical protein GE300_14780 [Rhodobacteraceae bacterium 2CG4]|uniref:Uncharacterized protein n=1 Tax=Halovulum marinum TaxID=2662447 RepID=A0A6L5Z2S6_9RHOB|nr:hypothetical protein [Halovulum marinum]MSU90866.1 hypothetical protein [Halovulum marinum]
MKPVIIAAIAILAAAGTPAAASNLTDQQVIAKWRQADASCQGRGSSRRAYPEACAVRARHAGKLESRGWCLDDRISLWVPCAFSKPED